MSILFVFAYVLSKLSITFTKELANKSEISFGLNGGDLMMIMVIGSLGLFTGIHRGCVAATSDVSYCKSKRIQYRMFTQRFKSSSPYRFLFFPPHLLQI